MTLDPGERDGRVVTLRNETDGPDSRHLWAHLDQEGNLHIDGQDLGPKTVIVSSDGEYEWFETIDRSDLPKLIGLLGGKLDDDILDVLEENWTGQRAGDLEALLREGDIKVDRFVEDITLHPQLSILTLEVDQTIPLIGAEAFLFAPLDAFLLHPVTQRPRVDPQIPSHHRYWFAGLPDNPHRPLTKLRVILSSYL